MTGSERQRKYVEEQGWTSIPRMVGPFPIVFWADPHDLNRVLWTHEAFNVQKDRDRTVRMVMES